jgi:membrane-bound ClpP family serine protease
MSSRTGKQSLLGRLLGKIRSPETGFELADEDLDTFGMIVEVVEPIDPDHSHGRIALYGTTWNATSVSDPIDRGEKAKVLYRDNLVWVVERYLGLTSVGEKEG